MKAIIFDLDGTLLNTLEDIGSACNWALGMEGFPQPSLDSYRNMVGNGFEMTVKRALANQPDIDDNKLKKLVDMARARYADHLIEHTRPYDGMLPALENLTAKNIFLGVLSNKPDDLSRRLIAHFFPEINFRFVAGARPDMPFKPDPLYLLTLLHKFQLEAASIYYAGDSNVDVHTALNAGATPVGAAWGFRGRRELEEAGAKIILEHPLQLIDLFNNNI